MASDVLRVEPPPMSLAANPFVPPPVTPPDPAWTVAALAGSTVFRGLSSDALADLARRVVRRGFRADATVITAGAPVRQVFLVLTGRIDAIARAPMRDVTIAIARSGDWFGDVDALGNGRSSQTWVAVEPTMTLALEHQELQVHLARHPMTAVHLVRDLARRLRHASARIAGLAAGSAQDRLEQLLVKIARRDGAEGAEGLLLLRSPTQQDLASQIGARRETVSRSLHRLVTAGLLVRHGRGLVVTHALCARVSAAPAYLAAGRGP